MKSESQNQKRKLPLTATLVISIIILALLGGAALFFVVNTVIRGIMYDRLISISERDVAIHAYEVDAWFLRYSNFIEHMATTWEAVGVDPGETGFGPDPIGARFLAESDALVGVFVGFENGWHVNSSGWIPPDDFDATTRPWYLVPEAAGGEVAITLPYVRLLDGDIVASIGVWRSDIIGMEAVVAADIRLQYVFDMIAVRSDAVDGFFMLVGPDGEIIVHGQTDYMLTPYQESLNLRDAHHGEMLMQSIQSGESLSYEHHIFGPVYFFSTPLSAVNWTLGAIIPTAPAEAQIANYLLIVMLVLLAFFIVFLVVSLAFAAKFFGRMKKKEVEVFELSQLLRENSPLSCIVFDDKFNPIDINQATVKLHRLPDKNFYIERFFDICPEYQPCGTPTKEAYIRGLKRGFEGNSEPFIWMHKAWDSDESIPVEVTLQRMETAKGAVLVCWARDMRGYYKLLELQQAEQSANEMTQLILNSAPLCVTIWDDEGNLIEANDRTVEFFGVDKREYENRFAELWVEIQPCGTPAVQKSIELTKQIIANGSMRYDWAFRMPSGEEVIFDVAGVRIERDGKTMILEYYQDLREIRAAQEKEREAEKFSRIIQDNSPILIEMWDSDYNFVSVNKKMMEVLGINSVEEFAGDVWRFSPELQPCGKTSEQVNAEIIDIAIEQGYARCEYNYLLPNGELLPTEITFVLVEFQDRKIVIMYAQDLRLIKAAQEKERETERFNRIIQDSSPILIETWDTDGNFVLVNKKMMEVLGINSVEEFAANVWRFSPKFQPCGKTSEEKNAEMIAMAMEHGITQCEYNYLLPNGELMPTEVTLTLVEYQDSKLVIGYAQDLRQIKEATKRERELEIKLQEQEMNERVRVMFDAAPIIIEFWNRDYTPVDCNLTALNYYGLPSKEEYSNRMFEFFEAEHPNTRAWRENLDKVFQAGFGQFEFTDHKPSGEVTSLEVQAVRLKLEGEDVVVTYSQDVTQIKESERAKLQALEKERESHELMSLLIESSPVFMEIWHDGQLVDCNEQCVKLFGLDNKDEFITRYEELSPPYQPCGMPSLEKAAAIVQETMQKGYTRTPWLHQNVKTGEEIPVEVIFVLLKPSDDRELIVGYNIDMRPIIKVQEEQKRSEIAEEASRAKSNFLARMSHEIRTPITAVMGISEIGLQDPTLPSQTGESFAKIYNSANSLLRIVNDILDLSKIESGKMELAHSKYKISHMILYISQIHLAFVGSKDIKFTVQVDENLPTHLVGDALRIVQIVNNVLSNAFKYTLEGTVDLSFDCRQQEDEGTILLEIAIRDSGLGMNEEQLQDLSNEYTRYHEHEHRFIEGTGLGMPIVFNLAKLMDADIKIDSEVGVGTNVMITIPQKPASKDVIGADTARRLEQLEESAKAKIMKLSTHAEPMPYGKVLIVDDVEANLFVAKGLMRFYDLTIETCDSGYAAIDKVKQGNVYDIIFMDYMMPGINGTQTMQQLREIGYTQPIVALTANAMIGQAEEFVSVGFDGFISKPIQTQNLHSALLRFIKDKQPPEVIEAALVANVNKPTPKIDINSFQRNPELLTELKTLFVKNHKNTISTIRQALDEGDIDTAHRLAHTIKGSAAMIYEDILSQTAKEMEFVLAKKEQPTQKQMLALEAELERALLSIGTQAARTPADNANLSAKESLALLDKVKPLLASRNAACMAMLGDLRKIPFAESLCSQIEDYNFKDALETLEELQKKLEDAQEG